MCVYLLRVAVISVHGKKLTVDRGIEREGEGSKRERERENGNSMKKNGLL